MDHIDPSLTKGIRMNYPNFGKARPRAAITQRTLLTDMLNALIKAEAGVGNILEVVSVACGGKQFLAGTPLGESALSFPSVAEQTITCYTPAMTPPRAVERPWVASSNTSVGDAVSHTPGPRRREGSL